MDAGRIAKGLAHCQMLTMLLRICQSRSVRACAADMQYSEWNTEPSVSVEILLLLPQAKHSCLIAHSLVQVTQARSVVLETGSTSSGIPALDLSLQATNQPSEDTSIRAAALRQAMDFVLCPRLHLSMLLA